MRVRRLRNGVRDRAVHEIRGLVKLSVALVFAGFFVAGTTAAQTPSAPPAAPQPTEPTLDTAYVFYDRGITLPLGLGIRIPAYNRVDGLALPWGPHFVLADRNVIADATLTYRSHIGELDPALQGKFRAGRGNELEIFAGRGTFTNDGWIRSNLINSLAAIGVGTDARNYFRADRATAMFSREMGDSALRITPSIGALHENAWSTGSPVPPDGGPWSIFGRTDSLKMRRPNPSITRGHTTSALGGVDLRYGTDSMKISAGAGVEHAFESPPRDSDGFTQYTFGSKASFFTFGTQKFNFRGHGVFSSGAPPPQRYVYLGGGGTLATLDLLALGGDRLLFVEGEYLIPLRAPLLPFAGAPVISVRYAAGSAGIGELPALVQNIGIGVGVKLLKAEYHFDPSYRRTPYSKRSAFSIGFSLSL